MTASTDRVDAIVIGAGQGGGPLAGELASVGWRVAVIEREHVGGTCINVGCTPTKTMIASARVAYLATRAADYGVRTGPVTVDQVRIRQRKRDIVADWREGNRKRLERWDTLELIMGCAAFVGPHEIRVTLHDGGERRLASDTIVVNTGARPRISVIPGLDDVPYLDSASIMELGEVPEHLIVVGGGYVGLEFGQMFRRFGAAVTIIETAPRCLPREDPDVCAAMSAVLEEDGVDLLVASSPTRVWKRQGKIVVTVETPGGARDIGGTHLLLATGRRSNADALELEAAGIEVDERGYIRVNERLGTNVPGVYAIGDANGGPAFTHVSYDDFRILRANLLDGASRSTAGRLVPYSVYTDPQLGRVGLSEDEARRRGGRVGVAKIPMSWVARALEVGESRGLMKALVDLDSGHILGAAVLGIEGGELMSMLQIAMMGQVPYTALRDGVFAHPTLAEALNNLFKKVEPLS